MRILIIEDDPDIVKIVRANAHELQAEIDHAADGALGLEMACSNEYDILLLDLMLPELSGTEVCRKVREAGISVPIIMLTAKAEEFDTVLGLELGADDYLTKPFSIRILLARIKALLRRVEQKEAGSTEGETLTYGPLSINLLHRRVLLSANEIILTAMEFDLLAFLASNPGRPFTRYELTEKIWGYASTSREGTVNAQLSRLRKKIEPDPANPIFIKTVWGVGYRFARQEEIESD